MIIGSRISLKGDDKISFKSVQSEFLVALSNKTTEAGFPLCEREFYHRLDIETKGNKERHERIGWFVNREKSILVLNSLHPSPTEIKGRLGL